ncbi:MAG TPA: hypothetical protein VIT65_10950 [Microlunatus sp.]
MWSYTRGGDLEDTVMLDQSYLPTGVIAHRDLVRAITVHVRTHCLSPVRSLALDSRPAAQSEGLPPLH